MIWCDVMHRISLGYSFDGVIKKDFIRFNCIFYEIIAWVCVCAAYVLLQQWIVNVKPEKFSSCNLWGKPQLFLYAIVMPPPPLPLWPLLPFRFAVIPNFSQLNLYTQWTACSVIPGNSKQIHHFFCSHMWTLFKLLVQPTMMITVNKIAEHNSLSHWTACM